jgi:hypothetical protein
MRFTGVAGTPHCKHFSTRTPLNLRIETTLSALARLIPGVDRYLL